MRVTARATRYYRYAVFNANDLSNSLADIPTPASKCNYPGLNVGGPVRFLHSDFNKNNGKLFFFCAMEWQRQLPDPLGLDDRATAMTG
jgi:hypothetical protein